MLVQIYEITSVAEAQAIAKLGVEHIGVLVGDGSFPRELSVEQAAKIIAAVPKPSKGLALSLSSDLDLIEEIAKKTKPAILHLGALMEELTVDEVLELRRRLPGLPMMRSLSVVNEESIELAKEYDKVVEFILLDTYDPKTNQFGATGKPHDWTLSKQIVANATTKVILAGGLGPDNVQAGIKMVRPMGVDCKTKTDVAGKHTKDLAKVAEFTRLAKAVKIA